MATRADPGAAPDPDRTFATGTSLPSERAGWVSLVGSSTPHASSRKFSVSGEKLGVGLILQFDTPSSLRATVRWE